MGMIAHRSGRPITYPALPEGALAATLAVREARAYPPVRRRLQGQFSSRAPVSKEFT